MEFAAMILPVVDWLLGNRRNHDIRRYSHVENETLLKLSFQIVSDSKS